MTEWVDGVFRLNGQPTIGRPPVFQVGDREIKLPIHEAYMASRSLRQVAVFHRRGRKTGSTLEKVFQWLWANPKTVGKTLAPIRKQAKEIIWDDPQMLFHPNVCPPQIIQSINRSDLSITLKNGSMWSLDGADDPQKKRGSNVKVLHLTEAGDHNEAIWAQVYEPILVANGGAVFFEGNPRGKNWYYRLFMDAQNRSGWETFLLSAKNSPIFAQEELTDLAAHTPDAVFRAEYLCEWVDSSGTVFKNYERLATATAKKAEKKRRYRFGIDLGKMQDFTVITVVDRHTWNEVAFVRFNQIDWTIQQDRILTLLREYGSKENENHVEVIIESNGIGEPVYNFLARACMEDKTINASIVPFTTTNASKAMLVSNLSMLFDMGTIHILPEPEALKELGVFTYTKTSLGFIYGAPDGEHDDCTMSKCFAYWDLGIKFAEPMTEEQKPKTRFGFTDQQWKTGATGHNNPLVGGFQ